MRDWKEQRFKDNKGRIGSEGVEERRERIRGYGGGAGKEKELEVAKKRVKIEE